MGEKIVVGPVDRGLRTDRLPFNIDNDSFPQLINAYQWRGRIRRKRGTSLLNRLTRFFNSTSTAYSSNSTATLINDGMGNGLVTLMNAFNGGLQANGAIVPGSVVISDITAGNTYTDPSGNGILVGSPTGSGTINYASTLVKITAAAGDSIEAQFLYFPDLPVMGLEDFIATSTQFPGTIGFDTTYSYNIVTSSPYSIYDVSFYKNPPANPSTLPGYVQKTIVTPTTWNGQDYQQFWTVNYQGALWTTNGITEPFSPTSVGMQFKPVTNVSNIVTGPPATAKFTINSHGLVIGDFLFFNEFSASIITGINFQTGYVIMVNDANNVTVEFPNATLAGTGGATSSGIAQYLTNRSNTTIDCLRWYDGDPTNGNATTPTLNGNLGWVNFAPPLSQKAFSIADLPSAQYYLVGARLIWPFKDRLLFLGPIVQTSVSGAVPMYLKDTIIYSQNGTPYYTSSFTNQPSATVDTPTNAGTVFNPILVPANQTATAPAYFEDATGFGGFLTAGVDQEIVTLGPNEDVLIVGFTRLQTRLVYTGNDIIPFNFFIINSEFGSGSTFSSITMDKGILTRGSRGFLITSQTGTTRFDLEILDQVFQINLINNGQERVAAHRDYINEWIYFSYPSNQFTYRFPTQTLQYNYREQSWAIFNESYTTYGSFRVQTGFTWATIGNKFPSWSVWNEPWNAGSSTLLQPKVIVGNQQGFVLLRETGTGEGNSLYIQNISGNIVTSTDHCLNAGDYIVISGAMGTVASQVNGNIFSIGEPITDDTFTLNPNIAGGTYIGGGLIQRMYVPFVQTKQFPVSWGFARKTRLGFQQYLLTTTNNGQITLLIFLSQDFENAYNQGAIVPEPNSVNDSLIYSTVLFTCPESTNLGLTPANINLNMLTAQFQEQIWHRINTSLIGDTVQLGFTMSDSQMRDTTFSNQFSEIELHGFILDLQASQLLA